MMYVLDTDHLGEYQKGTSPAAQRLIRRLDTVTEPVATTIITVEEVMRGWLAAIRRENDPRKQKKAYERLTNLFRFFRDGTSCRGMMPRLPRAIGPKQNSDRHDGFEDRQHRSCPRRHSIDL